MIKALLYLPQFSDPEVSTLPKTNLFTLWELGWIRLLCALTAFGACVCSRSSIAPFKSYRLEIDVCRAACVGVQRMPLTHLILKGLHLLPTYQGNSQFLDSLMVTYFQHMKVLSFTILSIVEYDGEVCFCTLSRATPFHCSLNNVHSLTLWLHWYSLKC